MPELKVDIAILGSGISASIAQVLAQHSGLKAIAIDPSPRRRYPHTEQLSTKLIQKSLAILRIPILVPPHSRCSEKTCICSNLETEVIRDGDYSRKLVAFEEPSHYQTPWLLRWQTGSTLCYDPFITALDEFTTLNHMIANVRVIDLKHKLIILTNGLSVRYRKLVYTWPLDRILYYIRCPTEYRKKLESTLHELNLRAIGIFTLILVVRPCDKVTITSITRFIHATRASRMHTALSIPIDPSFRLLYVMTSFSDTYPLLPGITEKLYSELRKHRILTNQRAIIHEMPIVNSYAILSTIKQSLIEELRNLLSELDVELFGRVAEWQEMSVLDVIARKPTFIEIP